MEIIDEYLNAISRQYDDLKSHSDFLERENRELEKKIQEAIEYIKGKTNIEQMKMYIGLKSTEVNELLEILGCDSN